MDDVDKPEDFRHYFTNMNPEKLLNTSLSKVEKQIKEALVSFFFWRLGTVRKELSMKHLIYIVWNNSFIKFFQNKAYKADN